MPDFIVIILLVMLGAAAGFIMEARLRRAVYRRGSEQGLRQRSVRWVGPVSAVVTPWLWSTISEGRPVLVPITYVVATWVLMYLAAAALDVHRLPYAITLPSYPILGVALFACSQLTDAPASLTRALAAAAVCFSVLFVVMLIDPTGRVGLDDAVLAGLIGMLLGWTGWHAVREATIGALVLGALVAAAFLLARRLGRRRRTFLLGPVMVASAIATLLPIWSSIVGRG